MDKRNSYGYNFIDVDVDNAIPTEDPTQNHKPKPTLKLLPMNMNTKCSSKNKTVGNKKLNYKKKVSAISIKLQNFRTISLHDARVSEKTVNH